MLIRAVWKRTHAASPRQIQELARFALSVTSVCKEYNILSNLDEEPMPQATIWRSINSAGGYIPCQTLERSKNVYTTNGFNNRLRWSHHLVRTFGMKGLNRYEDNFTSNYIGTDNSLAPVQETLNLISRK